jgi:hypothetical protein
VASLVLELQQDALNPGVPVSSLLRKVVVVARKLGLRDLESWTQLELRGYGRDDEIPDYRRIRGQVKAFNPYHGWQPVQFEDPETFERVSTALCNQSIGELETILREPHEGTLAMTFGPQQVAILQRAIGMAMEIALIVQSSSLTKILDAVRTAILEWALSRDQTALRLIEEQAVDLVVNTPTHGKVPGRAGFAIRRAAFERRLPCFTSLDTAAAFLDVVTALQEGHILSPQAAAGVSPL